MDLMDIKTQFNLVKKDFNITFDIKEEQLQVAKSVLNGRNVVGFLPTGYGKTLCLVIPTMVKKDEDAITLIISPLNSLIDDHMGTMREWNISCAKITADTDIETRIGNISIIDFICSNELIYKVMQS